MAELQAAVLGSGTPHRFSGASRLSVYRAGEVSADSGEVPAARELHAGGYAGLRHCAPRDGGTDPREGKENHGGASEEEVEGERNFEIGRSKLPNQKS